MLLEHLARKKLRVLHHVAHRVDDGVVDRKLSSEQAAHADIQKISLDEKAFRLALNEDAMATEKLAEGIRLFCADSVKLDALVEQLG